MLVLQDIVSVMLARMMTKYRQTQATKLVRPFGPLGFNTNFSMSIIQS